MTDSNVLYIWFDIIINLQYTL